MRVLATTIPLVIERHLIYCIYPSFKLMVYSKNDASLTYSHIFWNLYDFSMNKRIFSRMSKLLFSIQWKWIMTVKLFSEQRLRFSLFLTQSWHKTTFKVYFFWDLQSLVPIHFRCGEEQHEHSAKHLFFCFTQKRKTYGFGRTWWWVNDVRFSMFG